MTFKFCGLKYIFNNIILFKKDDKKSTNNNEIEAEINQRFAVFSRARSLKLIGPNLIRRGSDIINVEAMICDILPDDK
ncbi:Hypothetical protein SRAE_X000021600 [Strongyloides ratti]|uniref:Uncharacterized protein n=1 Tax=Strongyloides ratti TaxID=34506 RepID=A0A090LMB9_STRRB|nr:Hypothetical protein SRAE_X000021600 [Strongyloides ratti]CEF70886.1 Hypothetical protein SRAE_X000021600 [Strongyloides ratti]